MAGEGRLSDYRANKWLEDFESGIWLAAHYDNPDVAGAYASEVFGGSYQRVICPMTQATSRVVYNLGSVTFSGLPEVAITHLGGWDSQINGNLEFSVALASPVRIIAGHSHTIGPYTIAVSIV